MRKLKLLTSIGAFVLCLAMMVFGVYSALSVDFNIGGSITYDAVNIQATISAATVGSGLTVTDAATKMQAVTYNGTSATPANAATWSNLSIAVTDVENATLTFTITNTHQEKYLKVTVGSATGTATNASISYTNVTADEATYLNKSTAASGTSVTVVVNFNVTDPLLSASVTGFNIPIALEHATDIVYALPATVKTLSNCTATDIKAVAQHGHIDANDNTKWVVDDTEWCFTIGDTISFKLNDSENDNEKTQVVMELADFNHDKDANNQTIPFTFVTKNRLPSKYDHSLNSGNISQYNWTQSSIRSYLNDNIYSLLPEELKALIKPAQKTTLIGGGSAPTDVEMSVDKLFLLSFNEVGIDLSDNDYCNSVGIIGAQNHTQEGLIYPIFTFGNNIDAAKNSRIKSNGSSVGWWWLRTPNKLCCVTGSGSISTDLMDHENGIVFAFCI